jgi:hypothetical protein
MSSLTCKLTIGLAFVLVAFSLPVNAQNQLLSHQDNLALQQIQQAIRITQSQQRRQVLEAEGKSFGELNLSEEYILIAKSAYPVPLGRYAGAYGKPFLLPEHTQGRFYDLLKNEYALDSVNYNAHTGEFEFLTPQGNFSIVRGSFNRVELENPGKLVRTFYFDINPSQPKAYVEEIFHGERIFGVTYHLVNKHSARENMLTGETSVEVTLKKVTKHYVTIDGEPHPTPKTGKKLAKIAGVPSIQDFIKAENLDLRSLKDLKKVYEELDRLLKD